MGYVYLIEETNDYDQRYKIGYTKKEKSREDELKTGNPDKLKEVCRFKTNFNRKLETALHSFYKSKHIVREWFKLDLDDVLNFLTLCQKLEDNFKFLEKHKI